MKFEIEHTVNVYSHARDCEDITRILNAIILLQRKGDNIMTVISDFVAKQKQHNEKQAKAISDLTDDIKNLTDKIAELQSTAGQITPEDQALLDELDALNQSSVEKLDALNALTPPKPPADNGATNNNMPDMQEPDVEGQV